MAAEPPARRVPGYVLVLVLVAVGMVTAVGVVVLRPTPRLGPPVLLVLAGDTISSSPANVSIPADFGPHCSKWRWDEGRGHLTAEADVDFGGLEGLVLQHFTPATANFVTMSGDFLRTTPFTNGSAWDLTSPVSNRTVTTFVRSGEDVTVGNATYAPGASWTIQFAYDVGTPLGTVRITEDVTFRNMGVVTPRIVPIQACA